MDAPLPRRGCEADIERGAHDDAHGVAASDRCRDAPGRVVLERRRADHRAESSVRRREVSAVALRLVVRRFARLATRSLRAHRSDRRASRSQPGRLVSGVSDSSRDRGAYPNAKGPSAAASGRRRAAGLEDEDLGARSGSMWLALMNAMTVRASEPHLGPLRLILRTYAWKLLRSRPARPEGSEEPP
jgi:hypothetical protein